MRSEGNDVEYRIVRNAGSLMPHSRNYINVESFNSHTQFGVKSVSSNNSHVPRKVPTFLGVALLWEYQPDPLSVDTS